MFHRSRPYVLHEATLRQLKKLKPNVAVLPWGATEAHNYHLPYGTDVIEANALGEAAVRQANERGARCLLLPCIPVGVDHGQLYQVATLTMRASTQLAVLRDIAESLVRQDIDRLVLLNFHGGNEFKPLIRDVMFDLPIFIVQVNGYQLAPEMNRLLAVTDGDHANEFETSLMLHLTPDLVAPLKTAGRGATASFKLTTLRQAPGVWAPRDWQVYTRDTGAGDPRQATAEKGRQILALLVKALTPMLVELSKARNGDFPYVLRAKGTHGRPRRS
jgi:creatinine amidohydrolase